MIRVIAALVAAFIGLTPALAAGPSLNGSGSNDANPATTVAVTMTVANNDVMVCDIQANSGPVTSVTSSPSVTWTKHFGGAGPQTIERWFAVATSSSSITVTAAPTITNNFMSMFCSSWTGANTSTPFDSAGPQSGAGDPGSITTTNANDTIIGTFKMNSTASPTAGSGYTQIAALASSFQLDEFAVKSATGTFSVTITTGVGDANGWIVDGIKASGGGGGGGSKPSFLPLMGVGQ